jgi:hypothetical protein
MDLLILGPAGTSSHIYESPAQDELLDPPPALQAHSKGTQVRSRSTSVGLVLLDLDPPPPIARSQRNPSIC